MLLERIVSAGLAHYSYLVGDKNQALVIDPRRDVDDYIKMASGAGMRIAYVLETHRNEDFFVGSMELAGRTEAQVWHADGQWDYQYGQPAASGQRWRVGRLEVEAIATPGHTPGSMSYLLRDPSGIPWMLFCGDTLFAGEVGRIDLMGKDLAAENAGLLYESLFKRLLPLGDEVILCPAHGSGSVCGELIAERLWTTIGLEKKHNARLQESQEQFVASMLKS
ncbi:MAG: MBL fold metallo-hydrolase [Methanothrix sp.]|nr:MBL fold metallo-hydrolase [Methanothrix sp.]